MPDLMKFQQIPRFYSAIEETWKNYVHRSKKESQTKHTKA